MDGVSARRGWSFYTPRVACINRFLSHFLVTPFYFEFSVRQVIASDRPGETTTNQKDPPQTNLELSYQMAQNASFIENAKYPFKPYWYITQAIL